MNRDLHLLPNYFNPVSQEGLSGKVEELSLSVGSNNGAASDF